jgi:hypothetical protein
VCDVGEASAVRRSLVPAPQMCAVVSQSIHPRLA